MPNGIPAEFRCFKLVDRPLPVITTVCHGLNYSVVYRLTSIRKKFGISDFWRLTMGNSDHRSPGTRALEGPSRVNRIPPLLTFVVAVHGFGDGNLGINSNKNISNINTTCLVVYEACATDGIQKMAVYSCYIV